MNKKAKSKRIKLFLTLGLLLGVTAAAFPVFAKENVADKTIFTTKGKDWVPVVLKEDGTSVQAASKGEKTNTFAMADPNSHEILFEKDGTPLAILEMNGSTWNFNFAISSNGKQTYYASESLKRESGTEYTVCNEKGDPVTYITVEDGQGTLVNKKQSETGNLVVSKTVVPSNTNNDALFRFDIFLNNNGNASLDGYLQGERTFGDTVFLDGKAVLYLKNGQSEEISSLPAGIGYKVEEVQTAGYEPTFSLTDIQGTKNETGSTVSDSIDAASTDKVAFTNTKAESPSDLKQNLHIVKKVKSDSESEEAFDFRISFSHLESESKYTYQIDSENPESFQSTSQQDADLSFSLKDNQEVTFYDLPVGSTYQVLEEAAPGFTSAYAFTGENLQTSISSYENAKANMSLTTALETVDDKEEATLIFTNTKEKFGLLNIHLLKNWNDNQNQAGKRPDSLMIYLIRTTNSSLDKEDWEKAGSIELSKADAVDENTWQGVFEDLPSSNEEGEIYTYSIQEEKQVLEDYTENIEEIKNPNSQTELNFEITNTYSPHFTFGQTGQKGIVFASALGLVILGISLFEIYKRKP